MPEQDNSESTASSEESSGAIDPRYPNLKPWKPGQSGNPAGRAKNRRFTELCEGILEDPAAMASLRASMVDAMSKSDMVMVHVAKIIAERGEGPVTQQISGPGGGPIPLEVLCDIDDGDEES